MVSVFSQKQMRRTHGGNYYEPVPSTSFDQTGGIESENDRMTEDLKGKISVLKSLSIDIGNEVKYQDKLLTGLDNEFERSGGFLGKTMNRVIKLSRGQHNYYVCYLLLFSIMVLFILYLVIKLR